MVTFFDLLSPNSYHDDTHIRVKQRDTGERDNCVYSYLPGTHEYNDPKMYNLMEGVQACLMTKVDIQYKFNEYRDTKGSHGGPRWTKEWV